MPSSGNAANTSHVRFELRLSSASNGGNEAVDMISESKVRLSERFQEYAKRFV